MLRSHVTKVKKFLSCIEKFLEIETTKANKIVFCELFNNVKPNRIFKMPYVTTWSNTKYLLNTRTATSEQKRFKSQKKKQEDSDESDEEDDDRSLDDDFELGKDFKEITVSATSLRVDAVIKAGLGLARHKAEEAVLDSRVRVNGEKVFKKGTKVNVGDEVDLIKGVNSKNEDFLDISRLLVRNIMEKSNTGKHLLILHRYKSMTIENYPNPWKGSEKS